MVRSLNKTLVAHMVRAENPAKLPAAAPAATAGSIDISLYSNVDALLSRLSGLNNPTNPLCCTPHTRWTHSTAHARLPPPHTVAYTAYIHIHTLAQRLTSPAEGRVQAAHHCCLAAQACCTPWVVDVYAKHLDRGHLHKGRVKTWKQADRSN